MCPEQARYSYFNDNKAERSQFYSHDENREVSQEHLETLEIKLESIRVNAEVIVDKIKE